MTSKERDPMWDFEIKDKLIYLWTTIVNLYGEIEPLESYQEENKIRARKCCEHILNHLERLETLEKENTRLNIILDDTKSDYLKTLREKESLKQENEKLKKAIEYEIELLIERRFNAYACDNYEVYNVIDAIIEELKEVLEDE